MPGEATGRTEPAADPGRQARSGALSAATCYLIWALVPLYWKPLAAVDPIELIAHRQVWSLLVLAGLMLAIDGGFRTVADSMKSAPAIGRLAVGAGLLTINWLVYVWGVNTGHVIETSLGYFLVPLFSVVAGRLVLKEQLRPIQWIAVAIAAVGVGILLLQATGFPWIALALAGSWGLYGVMRKRSSIAAIPGLTAETLLVAPAAIGYLLWRHHQGTGALGRVDLATHALIVSSGIITAIPLLLFAHAARRIRLSTLGLLQYIAPTGQFILGVWVYHEPLSPARLASFALIWSALLLYTAENLAAQRRPSPRPD